MKDLIIDDNGQGLIILRDRSDGGETLKGEKSRYNSKYKRFDKIKVKTIYL